MSATKKHLVVVLFLFLVLVNGFEPALQFGPYEPYINNVTLCKGPKSKDLATNTLKLLRNGYRVSIILNSTIHIPVNIEMVRISETFINGKVIKKDAWISRIKNPCSNFLIGPVLIALFRITDGCYVEKGSYYMNIDLTKQMKTTYPGSFPYGRLLSKTTVYSSKGNLGCVLSDTDIKPADTNAPK